jgi:hypothetical protein
MSSAVAKQVKRHSSKPKGKATPPKAKGTVPSGRVTPKPSNRYTPPVPKAEKVSPVWVPVVMFASLGVGMAVILVNYVSLLPGSPSNMYLLLGLFLITLGFVTATKYH